VADNTGENSNSDFDLRVPKPSARDEVESAKILFQEGLLDEAKKILHRIIISHPSYAKASMLLKEIQKTELDHILNRSHASSDRKKLEDPENILRKLEADLGISIDSRMVALDSTQEHWIHSMELGSRERLDLAIAFFEMGCYRDADRELIEALRIFRVENSSLDESGVSIVALRAESLIRLEEAFEAKMFLAPILNEPEISHELKLPLYYLAARSEELLGGRAEAKAWLQKVMDIDPLFRDANFRIRLL
jgi:tetratricopeptide (TPR) repeat protein